MPPSLCMQRWLSALSLISADQIIVNRFAFTLVCRTAIMTPFTRNSGRLEHNPSSKYVKCIGDLLYWDSTKSIVYQWQVSLGLKFPIILPPHLFSVKKFSQADLVLLPVPGKKKGFPHHVRCFGAHFPGLCEKLCKLNTLLSLLNLSLIRRWKRRRRTKNKQTRQRPIVEWATIRSDSVTSRTPQCKHDTAIAVCQ